MPTTSTIGWATNSSTSTTTGGITSAANQIWLSWFQGTSATSTTTNASVIYTGNTAEALSVWSTNAWQQHVHSRVPLDKRSAAQIAKDELIRRHRELEEAPRRAAEAARYKKEQEEKAAFKVAAKGRAKGLLSNFLTPEQKRMLGQLNYFEVTVHGKDGVDRRYRIEQGYAGNVKLLDAQGNPVKRFCIHADSRIPEEDNMLAQKLLLEANEEDFVRIANKTCMLTGAQERGRLVAA